MAGDLLEGRRKRLLVVLFVPSVERDGETEIDQDSWVEGALNMFGNVFGAATAFPKGRGIWRDDDRGGKLVRDNPVVLHAYMEPEMIENSLNLDILTKFCKKMGREANQGEVGIVIADEYLGIVNFAEE